MRESCFEVNKTGIVLDKLKMEEATCEYAKQYSRGCYLLWSLGYSSSSSYFDVSDFLATMPLEYLNMMKNKTTGELVLTYEMIDFILCRSMHSEVYNIPDEYTSVLRIVRDIFEAEKALTDFANLSKTVRIPKRTSDIPVKTYLTVSSSVLNSGKAPTDSPFIWRLIKINHDEEFYELSFILPVIENVCKKINYPMDKLKAHRDNNESVFLGRGFTFDDDIRFFKLIHSGAIEGESRAGKRLFRYISDYYEKFYNENTTCAVCIRFEHQNFMDSIDDCIEYVRNKKEICRLKGYTIKYVNTFNIVYVRKKEGVDSVVPIESMFVGSFCFDNSSGERLAVENQLMGMSGEYVSKYSVKHKEYEALGLSVDMLNEYGYMDSYYPIVCTNKFGKEGVVPLYAKHKKPRFRNIIDECRRLEVDNVGDISKEIANSVTLEYNGRSLGMLVGLLVQALICVECDYIQDGHISATQVLLDADYSWLDGEGWGIVIRKSANLFRCLGFVDDAVSA